MVQPKLGTKIGCFVFLLDSPLSELNGSLLLSR